MGPSLSLSLPFYVAKSRSPAACKRVVIVRSDAMRAHTHGAWSGVAVTQLGALELSHRTACLPPAVPTCTDVLLILLYERTLIAQMLR